MRFVTIHEAKTHLSRLIKDVEEGGEVVIRRGGKPVVKLVPVTADVGAREPGMWAGQVVVREGAFAPLTDEDAAEFYGEA